MRLANSSCDNAGLVHQGTLHQARGPHPVHKAIAYTSADQPVKDVAGSGKVYMDFGTAMEIIVVTVNAYGSTRSNTQIMLRVVSLEEELFDVPRVGNILVTRPSRGYLGLQVQRFRAYSAWSLQSDGREHGGRGFQAGRSGISAARMAKIQGNRYRRMRRPTTSKLLLGILACPFSVGSLKPAIFVVTAVGPLLTISGRCPGESRRGPWHRVS